jgi:hypothetical protein
MADVGMTTTSFPAISIDEITASKPVYFISLPKETVEKVLAKLGAMWTEVTIPANAYKGQTRAVPTIGGYGVIISRPELDETLAYSIVKAVYEHQQEFWSYHAGPNMDVENTIMWAIPITREQQILLKRAFGRRIWMLVKVNSSKSLNNRGKRFGKGRFTPTYTMKGTKWSDYQRKESKEARRKCFRGKLQSLQGESGIWPYHGGGT